MATLKRTYLAILIVALLANALPLSSAHPVQAQSPVGFQDAAAAFYARFHCSEPWPTTPVDVDQVACELHRRLCNGGSWDAYRKYGIGFFFEILTVRESQALGEHALKHNDSPSQPASDAQGAAQERYQLSAG